MSGSETNGSEDRDYVNEHEVRVIGMSRSGNHAIINWIFQQASGRVCFLNCVEPKTNPFVTARPLENGQGGRANYPELDPAREAAGDFTPKDWLIYNHEDCFLGMVTHEAFESNHDRFVGRSRRRKDVLILRDPFNLFASRSMARYEEVTPATAVRIWKQHAREFIGSRRYLPPDRVAISFNRWTTDRHYRQEIAEQLGLDFTDAGFENVSSTGGGSSFDRLDYDGRASQMRVLERWKRCADDEDYLQWLDAELFALSEEIFGPIPGTRALMQRTARRAD